MGTDPGVAVQPAEATFVIDDRQRIVAWSYAASVTLGVSEKEALGQPCAQVVRGLNSFGKAVCRFNCPGFKAIQSGHLTARCSLVLANREGPKKRFTAELVALPDVTGGALVTLLERRQGPATPAAGNLVTSVPGHDGDSVTQLLHDMAALTTLITSLSPDRLEQSIEKALDWLREGANAEAAELFMVGPRGGDMLLTAYRGPFRNSFEQITCFHAGEGFPGLIQRSAAPIITQSLTEDPRFLRTQVKKKGFHSYVCVPLLGPSGVIGALNVAARRRDFDLARAFRLLTWASHPISTALQAGLSQSKENIGFSPVEVPPDAEQGFDGLLRAVLHQMMLTGQANGGALVVYDWSDRGPVRQVKEGEFVGATCPDTMAQDPLMCPALADGRGIALYGPRHRWPSRCRHMSVGNGVVHCLPLVVGAEKVGVVQVAYGGPRPSPPTRHLAALLATADQAALAVRQAWKNLQDRERTLRLHKTLSREVSKGIADAGGSPERPLPWANGSPPKPVSPSLEIRCFGAFEFYRQGKLAVPDMFKRRKAMNLLQILLIHGGRRVSRDALEELLWPEADPEAAANRFYVLVHTLRRLVEPTHQDQHWVFICNEGDRYYFNPEAPYRLDIREFREDISLGELQERQGDPSAAIDAYEMAVDLYRGDLLEDESYAEWCCEEREVLKETFLTALRRLAGLHMEQSVPEKSVEAYRRALTIDPLREENHQGLMRALWATGRRDGALRQYQICREVLHRELGVGPLPETEELSLFIREFGER